MLSGLSGRVARLEGAFKTDPLADVAEFRFADHVQKLPVGTIVPEGARVVSDFYEDFHATDWGGRPGVVVRSGYYSERIAVDPDDEGRILPVSEDPYYQELLKTRSSPDGPKATEAKEEFVLVDGAFALNRG